MTVDMFFVFFFYSPYYSAFDIDDGISLLEESLADVMLSLDGVYLLLCGDLNTRTANEFPIRQTGNDVFTRPVEETPTRYSEDIVLNSFGKPLLNICTAFGLDILNRVCHGDLQSRYTFMSNCGNSMNDYFMDPKIFFLLFSMIVGSVLWKESSQTICHWNCIQTLKK